MMGIKSVLIILNLFSLGIGACSEPVIKDDASEVIVDSFTLTDVKDSKQKDVLQFRDSIPLIKISSHKVSPDSILSYAQSLIGTPYRYASTDPLVGFDCSGFITYVFNHYKVQVPRSSKDFENVGTEIPLDQSRKGDLILFRGTDSAIRTIGHMGIILSNLKDTVKFIHSSSGKANGVVISDVSNYYKGRFVKVVRVFY